MVQLDKLAIACNLSEPTKVFAKGALAYIIWPNHGNGCERIEIYARSRSGRWVRKFESSKRLKGFRSKTIPDSHPFYETVSDFSDNYGQLTLKKLQILESEE